MVQPEDFLPFAPYLLIVHRHGPDDNSSTHYVEEKQALAAYESRVKFLNRQGPDAGSEYAVSLHGPIEKRWSYLDGETL